MSLFSSKTALDPGYVEDYVVSLRSALEVQGSLISKQKELEVARGLAGLSSRNRQLDACEALLVSAEPPLNSRAVQDLPRNWSARITTPEAAADLVRVRTLFDASRCLAENEDDRLLLISPLEGFARYLRKTPTDFAKALNLLDRNSQEKLVLTEYTVLRNTIDLPQLPAQTAKDALAAPGIMAQLATFPVEGVVMYTLFVRDHKYRLWELLTSRQRGKA